MALTYDICRYIFIGGLIMTGVMFAVTVLLFFLLRIPSVIGDLSGRTAKKAIENIRSQNEDSGDKLHKTSHINRERGKITDKISPSGNLIKRHTHRLGAMPTEKIGKGTVLPPVAQETAVLDSGNETTVLGTANETAVLGGANETTVLGGGETTILDSVPSAPYAPTPEINMASGFTVEYDITYIHANELIQ